MILIDENGHERVETMKTIQMYTKYNQYGNNPAVDPQFVPYEPHGYLAFALGNNARDRARRRAEQRQRDAKTRRDAERAATAVNAPEIQALRLQRQRELELEQRQLEKPAETADGGSVGGARQAGDGIMEE